MIPAPIPHDDVERVAALRRYCVLDTLAEPAFDRLTKIAQHIFGTPTALVSLIDTDRQWFKSRIGLDASETPRNISFCGYAVYHRELLIVPDAYRDPRFADNPLVAGPPGIRFYVGAPLINTDGFALGTLCLIDYIPHKAPTEAKIEMLRSLADVVVDTLERRVAAQALAAKTQLLQTTMDSISQGISAFDAELKLTAWNRKFLELLEFPLELGRYGEEFASFIAHNARRGEYGPGNSDEQVAARVAVARRFEPHCVERVRPDGHVIEIKGVPIPGGGFVSTYTDITDMRRNAEELQRRLDDRERIERLKNEFVSTVSHELRTPLTSIAGMLELLDAEVVGVLPAEVKDMVNVAYTNSQRLIRLINDILDIEKIESGLMPFDLAQLPLMPLIERAMAETKSFAQGLGVGIKVESRTKEAIALVDPDRFIQVLTNLVSNAAKFSPKGEAVLVTLDRTDDRLRVSVADRGPGIPEGFRGRIFEKFAQADGSDSRRLAGTGLGLAIVKKIVEHMDGTVSFNTETGRGTTFHVDLPEWKGIGAAVSAAPTKSQAA
jgi:signal transduction histidine kinase